MKKIGGIFLAVLTFFASTLNVFAQAIEEVVEEKTQTINKEDYESLKEEVEHKVFEMNESDDEYVYDYEISIIEEKDEVVITESKTVTSEQKFTSESDAQKYYDEYELEDSWKQGELTITSKDEDIVVNGDEITITCKEETCSEEIAALESALNEYQELEVVSKNTKETDDEKIIVYEIDGKVQELHYEDAIRLVATLNPELEGYTLVKNEYVLVKKGSVSSKTFKELVGNDKFETYEEAKEAADKFLANDDYESKVAVVVAVYDETEKEQKTDESLGFLTEDLALAAAIAQASKELETAIEDGKLTIETTIEEAKNALEKAYETGKLEISGLELDGKVVYYSLPELRTKEESSSKEEYFYTKAGAELAKAILERANENSEETGISYEDITLSETSEDVTLIRETEEFSKSTYGILTPSLFNYYSLKNGNNVVIWTENALTAEQKEDISKSQKELNPDIQKIEFVTGFNTEYTVDGIGTFTFKKESVTTMVPTLSIFPPYFREEIVDKYSLELTNGENTKLVAGVTTTAKKYKLSYKQVSTTELWYYDRTEIKYGFDYTVQGGGAEVTRDLFQVQSILAGKIYDHTMAYRVNTTNTYTSYVASFDIYKEETQTKATVAYKITKEKAATGTTGPNEDDNTNNNQPSQPENNPTPEENPNPEDNNEGTGTVLPPNTGVEVNFFLEGALLISILVAAVSLKKLCK